MVKFIPGKQQNNIDGLSSKAIKIKIFFFLMVLILILIFLSKIASYANGEILCPFKYINESIPLEIELKFRFYQLIDFHEKDGVLESSGYIIAKWYDPCGWNLAQTLYPNRTNPKQGGVAVDRKYFWIPILVQEHDDNAKVFDTTNTPLYVSSNGYIELWGRKTWLAKCQGHFSKFPLDQHHCSFVFNSWDSAYFVKISHAELDLSGGNYQPDSLTLFSAQFQTPRTFTLDYSCNNELCDYDWVEFPLLLSRQWFPFYFHSIFIPFILLSLIQLMTFLLHFNEMDRICLSATVFLSYAVFSSHISYLSPVTSEHIYIIVVETFLMVLSIFSTIFYTVIFSWRNSFQQNNTLAIINRVGTIVFLVSYFGLFLCMVIFIFIF